jgi:hypothetical protein
MEYINLDDSPHIPIYKPFEGAYVETMPALRAEGRIPMSLAGLMKRRLQVLKSGNQELIDNWWENDIYSSTGLAYYKNKIKIVENPKFLLGIRKNARLFYGGKMAIAPKQFHNLEGQAFLCDEVTRGKIMSRDEVIEQLSWKAVAKDNELLKNYADAHFQKYNADIAMAFVSGPSEGDDIPMASALMLNRGGGAGGGSCLYEANLNFVRGVTLIGVRKVNGIEAII